MSQAYAGVDTNKGKKTSRPFLLGIVTNSFQLSVSWVITVSMVSKTFVSYKESLADPAKQDISSFSAPSQRLIS